VQVRVLVVEDHIALANRIGEGLRDAGFAVDVVYDGAPALQSTTSTDYDVVVLDRDLPAVHGDRACRRLVRDRSPSRILMLTAATDVEDRADGLERGADDYLGKPFAFGELIARIRALGRRGPGSPALVQRGDLVVDRARHRASRAGIPLTLTRPMKCPVKAGQLQTAPSLRQNTRSVPVTRILCAKASPRIRRLGVRLSSGASRRWRPGHSQCTIGSTAYLCSTHLGMNVRSRIQRASSLTTQRSMARASHRA
jgi:CheY-like chemotaxis protein